MEPNKPLLLKEKDTISKKFITEWLTSRRGILKKNLKISDPTNVSKIDDSYPDDIVTQVLNRQFELMNNAPINPSKNLPEGFNGGHIKQNGISSIKIADGIINESDSDLLDRTITHERTHALQAYPQEFNIGKLKEKHYIRGTDERTNYLNSNEEIYARLMALRKQLNLNPDKIVTEDDLKQWGSHLNKAELKQYPKKFLLDLFNTIAQNKSTKQINNLNNKQIT